MNTVTKIEDVISKLDELDDSINIVLDTSYFINTKADLASIKQRIDLARSNDKEQVSKLLKVKEQLESRLENIKNLSSKHSELVMRMDDFLVNQRKHLPRFELKSNRSVLDRIHPFHSRMNLSKSHKELSTFYHQISIADKVELINDVLSLTGRKKVHVHDGDIASTACSILGSLLNATFHKKGFYLVKKAIDYSNHQGNVSPADLLFLIVQYYNRRTSSISMINHQYE